MNNTQDKNQKDLIYVDKATLKKVEREIYNATLKLNNFYQKAVAMVGTLKIYNPMDYLDKGDEVIQEELKTRFQFPDASDSFNLQAMGIDPTALLNDYNINCFYWQDFYFELKGDKFVPAKVQNQISTCYYYANTEERKRVMKLAQKVIEIHNELAKSNMIDNTITFTKSLPFGLFANDGNSIKLSEFGMESFIRRIDQGEFSPK